MSDGCVAVCKAIQQQSTLRELLLSQNFIGPGGAKAVSKVLLNKKYITELGLNTNGIFAEGAVAIGQSLKD